jgi:hypothetical protein
MVTVSYRQYAYADTKGTGSYQLAYVLHPATMWKEFGPIDLTVSAPEGITCRGSTPLKAEPASEQAPAAQAAAVQPPPSARAGAPAGPAMTIYKAVLSEAKQKSGELFIALDKAAWDKQFPPAKPEVPKGASITGSGTLILSGTNTAIGERINGGTLSINPPAKPAESPKPDKE